MEIWTAFIFELLDWLKECLEERRREEVEVAMLQGRIGVRRGVTKILRRQDFHGRALREEVDEAMGMLAEMDAEDISYLLDEAEAHSLRTKGT